MYRLGCNLFLIILLLSGCERSHVAVQYPGSMVYAGGISEIDTEIADFITKYSFDNTDTFISDASLHKNDELMTLWLFRQIQVYYMENVGNNRECYFHHYKFPTDDYNYEHRCLSRNKTVVRVISLQIIDDYFVVIDGY